MRNYPKYLVLIPPLGIPNYSLKYPKLLLKIPFHIFVSR